MSKKNFILGGIFIILLTAAYLYKHPLTEWRINRNKPDNFLATIDFDNINKMEIINKDKTIGLEKKGEKWHIINTKDFYVKPEIITQLIDEIKKAGNNDLEKVSANADKKAEFATDKENGVEIKFYNNDELKNDIIVGKTGGGFNSTYVSLPEGTETYLAKSALFGAINRDDWYDKTIFSVDKDKISSIRFQYPTREFTIEKKDDKWQGVLPYKFSVDKEKVAPIVDIMANLRAVRVPKQDFNGTGLEKNLIIIEAKGEGFNNVLMIGEANEDGDYYAKRGDSDNIYLISKEKRDELNKRIRDLR